MKILAIILARGGSKRLPRKNLMLLDGLPLIAWTLRVANCSEAFHDVLVSTDSEEIAAAVRAHGGEIPWLRPAELARDTSTPVDALIHAVKAWERDNSDRADAICLLQPTSPFRKPETLSAAVAQFTACNGKSVIGVSPATTNPYWCVSVSEAGCVEPLNPKGLKTRSQDLPSTYEVNGLFYIVSRDYLLSEKRLYTEPTYAMIITDQVEALDIDTPFDWAVAERSLPKSMEA